VKRLPYPFGSNRFTQLSAELLCHLGGAQIRMLDAEAQDGLERLVALFLEPGQRIPGARQ
jgi:hypothetical protein